MVFPLPLGEGGPQGRVRGVRPHPSALRSDTFPR
jgi:hypothetical protein